MTKAIHKRLAGDAGFTLIELMVVVMIIAVLIAIAIPSFLGFRKSAQDRAAQSEIRSVLLSEKAYWLEKGNYTAAAADITAFEPNSVINANPALGVTIRLNGTQFVCIERTSKSGTTYGIWESATGGTYYGNNGTTGLLANCPAAAPAGYVQGGW
jgi:type IV pilus assembly protein PilA